MRTDLHESVWPGVGTVARLEDVELLLTEDRPGPGCLPHGSLGLSEGARGVSQYGISVMTRQ